MQRRGDEGWSVRLVAGWRFPAGWVLEKRGDEGLVVRLGFVAG
jgi:hypothetical protein